MSLTRGRIALVPQNAGWITAIQTELEDEEKTHTIDIQAMATLGNPAATLGYQVEYWIGEASFRTPAKNIAGRAMKHLSVSARQVNVNLRYDFQGAAIPPIPVSVGVGPGGRLGGPAGEFAQWYQAPTAAAALADSYVVIDSAGRLLKATANLFALPIGVSVLWALCFDKNILPVAANAVPIPGGRSTPLSLVNGPSSIFVGDFAPIEFSNGLVVALSAQPDVYVAPPAGAQFTFDACIGV